MMWTLYAADRHILSKLGDKTLKVSNHASKSEDAYLPEGLLEKRKGTVCVEYNRNTIDIPVRNEVEQRERSDNL